MRVYLDYNATTPLDSRVREEMARVLEIFGNPSSIHAEGREARSLVDEARVRIGRFLNCDHRRLIFTSGGTESNNLAVSGAARANREKGNHIVTSSMEHSAVLNPCHQLEKEGFVVTYVEASRDGMIDPQRIFDAMRKETTLVSIMMANNEVGTIQPIRTIAEKVKQSGVMMHTDAVQAAGKVPVDVEALGVDLLSISGHKIYGPKGAGILYVAPGVELQPLLRGGSHEHGLRAGTENVISVHGFGTAAKLLVEEGIPEVLPLRKKLEQGLEQSSMQILCKESPRLPNTVNFYSPEWLGESMVMAFDLEGIAVSNGSACSSGIIEPSHVILALGYNEDVARSVIRASVGKFTNEQEIDYFLEVVHHWENGGVRE